VKVELVSYTPDPLMTIAKAASNCYGTEPNVKVVDHCYKSGHHSVLEFADFHFHVKGLSRATAQQLTRHRLNSYAMKSQRYVNESDFSYVIPEEIKSCKPALRHFHNLMSIINDYYQDFIEIGIPQEASRYVLPNACTTTIDAKMNLRNLIHFCNERLCNRSQQEIRILAQEMKNLVTQIEPQFKKYLVPKCKKLGYCPEQKSCGKS
jgi:thymidylate synthase (FAD)